MRKSMKTLAATGILAVATLGAPAVFAAEQSSSTSSPSAMSQTAQMMPNKSSMGSGMDAMGNGGAMPMTQPKNQAGEASQTTPGVSQTGNGMGMMGGGMTSGGMSGMPGHAGKANGGGDMAGSPEMMGSGGAMPMMQMMSQMTQMMATCNQMMQGMMKTAQDSAPVQNHLSRAPMHQPETQTTHARGGFPAASGEQDAGTYH